MDSNVSGSVYQWEDCRLQWTQHTWFLSDGVTQGEATVILYLFLEIFQINYNIRVVQHLKVTYIHPNTFLWIFVKCPSPLHPNIEFMTWPRSCLIKVWAWIAPQWFHPWYIHYFILIHLLYPCLHCIYNNTFYLSRLWDEIKIKMIFKDIYLFICMLISCYLGNSYASSGLYKNIHYSQHMFAFTLRS